MGKICPEFFLIDLSGNALKEEKFRYFSCLSVNSAVCFGTFFEDKIFDHHNSC